MCFMDVLGIKISSSFFFQKKPMDLIGSCIAPKIRIEFFFFNERNKVPTSVPIKCITGIELILIVFAVPC